MKKNTQNGITLVALIITIIVLLILAMVSIKIAIDGGLTQKAKTATDTHTIAAEKEAIGLGYSEYQMALSNKENVTKPTIEGATVTSTGEGWNVTFTKTNNEYELKKDGTIENGSTADITPRTEVTYEGKTLKVGDYVDYATGTVSTWTTDASKGTGGDINLPSTTYKTEGMNWRVLGLDKNGNLELIADKKTSEKKLYLQGKAGYYNGVEQLNEMCNALYGQGENAQSARSVNVNDIDSLLGYDKREYKGEYIKDENNWQKYGYGVKTTYKATTSEGDWFRVNGSKIYTRKDGYKNFINIDGNVATDEKPITIENNSYGYNKSEIENRVSRDVLEMIFDLEHPGSTGGTSNLWLASQSVSGNYDSASWDLFRIDGDYIQCYWLFDSIGNRNNGDGYVRPVVTLKHGVKLSANGNGRWTINQ